MTTTEFNFQLINLENSLQKFAYRFVLNQPDAKDLVQETFLKVLINRDKYIDKENFKSWAFTIMKNTFINDYRHSSRRNVHLDQTKESFSINKTTSASFDGPDSEYSALEMMQYIEQLKDNLRMPYKMYINGYKYNEIADELNMNIGTVKSRIFLSRKQLMAQLNK
jgi:RNA polymerase sigma factor (sigma-70 family)